MGLMAGGPTLSVPCDRGGVNRRTVTAVALCRWQNIPQTKPPSSGRYQCLDGGLQIADLHLAKGGIRLIARHVACTALRCSGRDRLNGDERIGNPREGVIRRARPASSPFFGPGRWSSRRAPIHVYGHGSRRPFYCLVAVVRVESSSVR